jgi:hypothetical protein
MEENRLYENPEQFSLCIRVRERLPDLLEGYLDAMAAEAIRAHLSVCFMCAKVFGEMERTIRLVETLPFAEPIEDFAPAIMAALRAQAPPGHPFQTPVVEMETEILRDVSRPRTTTGQQRPFGEIRGISNWRLTTFGHTPAKSNIQSSPYAAGPSTERHGGFGPRHSRESRNPGPFRVPSGFPRLRE